MEKWIAVAVVACVAGCANMGPTESACVSCAKTEPEASVAAAPKERTLEQYLAAAEINAQNNCAPFKEARATARFKAMDLDGDGVLTQADRDAAQAAAKEAGEEAGQ
jgi:hypothetical protein